MSRRAIQLVDLDMSARLRKWCHNHSNVVTLRGLSEYRADQLRSFRGIGDTTVTEVRRILKQHGYSLVNEAPIVPPRAGQSPEDEVECDTCGVSIRRGTEQCERCIEKLTIADNETIRNETVSCGKCDGLGKFRRQRCDKCDGSGRVNPERDECGAPSGTHNAGCATDAGSMKTDEVDRLTFDETTVRFVCVALNGLCQPPMSNTPMNAVCDAKIIAETAVNVALETVKTLRTVGKS